MIRALITLLFFPLTAAYAIPTGTADLGPSRIVFPGDAARSAVTIGLTGTQLNGDTISFDVLFGGGHFVRAFSQTGGLIVDFRLPLDGNAPFPSDNPFINMGSGYFLDQNGNQVGNPTPLMGNFESFVPPFNADDVAIFGSLALNTPRPLDLYGFHFDLEISLPGGVIDETGPFSRFEAITITGTGFDAAHTVFGIGPNIPSDRQVPESGSTLVLFGVALCALIVGKKLPSERDVDFDITLFAITPLRANSAR